MTGGLPAGLPKNAAPRRADVRMEPAPAERFDIDWGYFGALLYKGAPSGRELRFLPSNARDQR